MAGWGCWLSLLVGLVVSSGRLVVLVGCNPFRGRPLRGSPVP